jgi:hypothetical protein
MHHIIATISTSGNDLRDSAGVSNLDAKQITLDYFKAHDIPTSLTYIIISNGSFKLAIASDASSLRYFARKFTTLLCYYVQSHPYYLHLRS